jgi:predicted RNA-binding protein with TRAM domain
MIYEEYRSSYRHSGRKPVELGKEYDVEVAEISKKGDGIARVQGFVIFVKNGKVGERPRIRIVTLGNRFAIGEIV